MTNKNQGNIHLAITDRGAEFYENSRGEIRQPKAGHYLAKIINRYTQANAAGKEVNPNTELLVLAYSTLIHPDTIGHSNMKHIPSRRIFAQIDNSLYNSSGVDMIQQLLKLLGNAVFLPTTINGSFAWAATFEKKSSLALAAAEFFLMLTFNIRTLKVCPRCHSPHWPKGKYLGNVCINCRREADGNRDRSSRKRKPLDNTGKFLNKVSQMKSRKKISDTEQKKLKHILEKDGLAAAQEEYNKLKIQRGGITNGRQH